jgi:enoyl-CoA hydratase/carnithine racemase
MDSTVIYQSKNGRCYLTLNRPDVFNALNRQLVLDLTAALKQAESEAEVRVIILKGAGKAWCAGGDLEELLQLTRAGAAERRAYLTDFKRCTMSITICCPRVWKPGWSC